MTIGLGGAVAAGFGLADADLSAVVEVRRQGVEALLGEPIGGSQLGLKRYPILAAYDHCLKCSHLFNLMDALGVISVTERAALMQRVRTLSCRAAAAYLEQTTGVTPKAGVRA